MKKRGKSNRRDPLLTSIYLLFTLFILHFLSIQFPPFLKTIRLAILCHFCTRHSNPTIRTIAQHMSTGKEPSPVDEPNTLQRLMPLRGFTIQRAGRRSTSTHGRREIKSLLGDNTRSLIPTFETSYSSGLKSRTRAKTDPSALKSPTTSKQQEE